MPDKIYPQKKEPHLLFLFAEDHLGNIGNDGQCFFGRQKKQRLFARDLRCSHVMSDSVLYNKQMHIDGVGSLSFWKTEKCRALDLWYIELWIYIVLRVPI